MLRNFGHFELKPDLSLLINKLADKKKDPFPKRERVFAVWRKDIKRLPLTRELSEFSFAER